MIGERRVLAIVPARGGSKGLPRKNIRELAGKPLIAWTLEAASGSRYIDHIIVSTDDEEIASVCAGLGHPPPFMRPAALAKDDTPGMDVVFHTLEESPGHDITLLLQPTSPLRNSEDIDQALESMTANEAPACVSVTEPDKSPYWMYRVNPEGMMQPLLDPEEAGKRRQDLPTVYVLNGALYIAYTDWLIKNRQFVTEETLAYKMPKNRSQDIDDETDRQVAEALLKINSPG